MTKIDITKSYQTRNGDKVRLISDQGSDTYPIVGLRGEEINPVCWTAEGHYYNTKKACEDDLIPAPQTIKTLPYRRVVLKFDEGYYVIVVVQDPSEPDQIKRFESVRGFTRWLDTDWITTSFDIPI